MDSIFALEGFDEHNLYEEQSNEENAGDIGFLPSDDEDSSTNGNTCCWTVLHTHVQQHVCVCII